MNIDVRQREAQPGIVPVYRPANVFVAGTIGSPRLILGSYVMALSLVGLGRAGFLATGVGRGRLMAEVVPGYLMIGCWGLSGHTLAVVEPG